MKRKWKIITTLGIIAVTCGVYVWGIPAIINIKSHTNFIEKTILENSGYKVDIGNPELSMGMFPSVWIKSDNISLINDDNSKALSIDNPKVKIKLLPLLFRKIEIAQFSAEKEEAYFTFTKDSKLLLGQYLIQSSNNSQFTLSKMTMTLGDYSIYLNDLKSNQQIALLGDYFTLGKYVHNKHLKFATKGKLKVGQKSSDIFTDIEINLPINKLSEDKLKIIANIESFDIASVSEYVKILTKNKIKSTKGIVNIIADTKPDKFGHKNISIKLLTNNLEISGKDKASSIIYKKPLAANINFTTVENGFYFKDTTIDSENIHAKVNGKLFNLGKKIPKYNLTAEVHKTRLEDVVAILPGSETLLPDFNLYKLKKYVFYGNGEGKITFQGQGIRPNVTGEVKMWDAYLIHPIKGSPANATIDLKFIGKKMLLDVFVPTSEGQSVDVNGMVLIDGTKYSELNIKSTNAVLLEPAQEILNPLHEILKFQLGPVPIMKVAGVGNIDLRSAGKKIDPHIWGKINFKNVTASFNEIHNLELHNGSGEVVFNNTQTTFRSYSAEINGRPVEIKGDCSVLGKLNVYVTSKGQNIPKMIKVINSSPLLADIQKVVKPFTQPEGTADLFLYIYGTARNAEEIVFNKDLFSKGTITLHNAKTVMQDTYLPFTKVNGVVNFDQYNSDYDITGYVRNSKLHVKGTGTNSEIDLKAHSDKFAINDISDLLHPDLNIPYKKEAGNLNVSFDASYKGPADADNIDYNKIIANGKFLQNMNTSNPIKLSGGNFTIKNGIFKTSKLRGLFNGNPYTLTLSAKDIYKEIPTLTNTTFNFKNFDISAINNIKKQIQMPENLETQVNNIDNLNGIIDISGSIRNNNINADTNIDNISFVYTPLGTTVKISNGDVYIRNNKLYLDKINSRVSSMPVFVDGTISNFYKNPNLNLSISTKLTQSFFDRFYNSKFVYPVKTKGDINFYTRLKGPINAVSSKSTLNLGENASIYYMGATLAGAPTGAMNSEGITTNPVSVIADATLYPDKIKLNSLNYNQTITSQNKKKSVQNQVHASGEIALLKNNIIAFKNLKIKTENPTNARIFNVLFKKPTIKQGVFTSDLNINGTSAAPYILGTLNVKSIDIPLLDATIRDINIDCKKDFIKLNSKGNVLTSDILVDAKIVNKPSFPVEVEDVKVMMDTLDLNIITNRLNDFDAENTRNNQLKINPIPELEPDVLIIKNARINADNILIKKAKATDFQSHITLGADQILNIDNYNFNIANGTVNGKISYNCKNYKSLGEMHINNADAQIISENFFDMPGQMFGTVTGDMRVSCTGLSSVDCINTLSGDGSFKVTDGRMPKLGSLEYLLKAGNLITGGITGVSINGIIDLITPLKTGNFKSISGTVHVKNGIADGINVYSSGQDLNMYMTGSYNLSTLIADMEVYGSLSKNFSTILGKIANSSLNTLFNTIPGVKINEINPKSTSNINKIPNFDKTKTLRVFKADIYGDINGSNYVKSFRWIKD